MHKKVSEIHRQKAELSEQHLAHILWMHSWIMWITELHHCAFVAIVAGKKKNAMRANGVVSVPFAITKGFTLHWKKE